jgi:hypothetical protein
VGRYVRVFVAAALAGQRSGKLKRGTRFDLDAVTSALGREGVESLYASWHQPLTASKPSWPRLARAGNASPGWECHLGPDGCLQATPISR